MMAAAFTRIVLIVVLAIMAKVTEATKLRYSEGDYNTLTYVNLLSKRPEFLLDCETVNPGSGAQFKRLLDNEESLHFHVYRSDNLDSRPALRVILKNEKGECCWKKDNKKKSLFYLTEMEFYCREGQCTQFVELTVRFHDKKAKRVIEIVMDLFKPALDTADQEHATRKGVPLVPSPIPERLLQKMNTSAKTQFFLGDLKWIEPVLKRAVEMSKVPNFNKRGVTKYTYMAGPVIINDEPSFNKILQLHTKLEKRAYQQS